MLEILPAVFDALTVVTARQRGTRAQRAAARAAGRRLNFTGHPSGLSAVLSPTKYREELEAWKAREDAANRRPDSPAQ